MKESGEETVRMLAVSLKRVLRGISDLQEAGHILQEVGRLTRAAQDCRTLSSITKAFESAKGVRQRVKDLSSCEGEDGDGDDDGGDGGGVDAGSLLTAAVSVCVCVCVCVFIFVNN